MSYAQTTTLMKLVDASDSPLILMPGGTRSGKTIAYFILDPKDTQDAANAARQRWAAYTNKGSQPAILDIHG